MFTPGPCAVYNVQWTMDVSAKHLLSAESQTAICYLLCFVVIHLKNNIIKFALILWDGIGLGTNNKVTMKKISPNFPTVQSQG